MPIVILPPGAPPSFDRIRRDRRFGRRIRAEEELHKVEERTAA